MLPTGLQMLPLLWLLLWMPKLGLPNPLSLGDEPTSTLHEDRLNHTHVQMVDIDNAIYKQFRNTPHSMYMVFNKTELRKAMPNPSLLYLAELHLYRRKQLKEQLVAVYEKYRNNTWHYLTHRLMAPSNTLDWLWFNVTEVVRQWLNQEDDIEVFRLRLQGFSNYEDGVLQMDIIGITPSKPEDPPDDDSLTRPFLILLTAQLKQPTHVDSSRKP